MASRLALTALLQSTRAAEFSSDMETMSCFTATAAGDTSSYVGQYCLDAGTWNSGSCCDLTSAPSGDKCTVAPQSDGSAFTSEAQFCGSKATLSNRQLREFLIPQDSEKCPEFNIAEISASTTSTKVHEFNQAVPTTSARDWHCKYGVSNSETSGYTLLIAENYGFDRNVYIIVQPKGKFLDFNFRSQTNNPEKMTKVFRSSFGRKYLIPAEYDIFIDFAPISYEPGIAQAQINPGKFQYRATHQADTSAYENDDTVTIVNRLPPLEGTETQTVPVADPDSDDGAIEITDDSVLPIIFERESAIDEDSTIGEKWRSWKDGEAFGFGGVSVSNEEAVIGSTALLIIIIGIVVICCFVSYLERKKIAEEARRASAYAKRASQKIRRSIKSMRGQAPEEEEPEAPKSAKEIKQMAGENASNKNEKAFLNDMFTD